jgi:uncharacterized protein (DUF58 family)
VNWRASARRDEPWSTIATPTATPTSLLLDTFIEAGIGLDTTLDLAVEGTIAFATGTSGPTTASAWWRSGARCIVPGLGTKQLQRVVEAVLVAEVVSSTPRRASTSSSQASPRRPSSPSPLIDARSIGIIAELAARGFDVAVVGARRRRSPWRGRFPPRPSPTASGCWSGRHPGRPGPASPSPRGDRGTPLAAAMDELTMWRRRHRVVVR